MSRYLILVILNLPLILAGLLGSIIDVKTGKISRGKYIFQTALWLAILAGLALARAVYVYLYNHHRTTTSSMSLFDVIEITGIIYILFMANRSRIKADGLERRLQELHQETSILLSQDKAKK